MADLGDIAARNAREHQVALPPDTPNLDDINFWLEVRDEKAREASEAFGVADAPYLHQWRNRIGRWIDMPDAPESLGTMLKGPDIEMAQPQTERTEAIAHDISDVAHGGLHMDAPTLDHFPGGGQADHKIVTDAGEYAGYIRYTLVTDDAGPAMNLSNVYLNPQYRNSGFGSRLTQRLFDSAREHGVHEITLMATQDGGYAWARAGFQFSAPNGAQRLARERTASFLGYMNDWLPSAQAQTEGRVDQRAVQDFAEAIPTMSTPQEVAMYGIDDPWEETRNGQPVTMWLGKKYLLDSDWGATLDLSLPEAPGSPGTTEDDFHEVELPPQRGTLPALTYVPPPPPKGKAGPDTFGQSNLTGLTNTQLGDAVEAALIDQLDLRNMHPERRQGPLDIGAGEYGFEVKACSVLASEYKAKPKKDEVASKRQEAHDLGLIPGTMIVIVEEDGTGHVYWREGIGAFRLTKKFHGGGTIKVDLSGGKSLKEAVMEALSDD